MATRESHVGDREVALATFVAALFLTRMISRAQSPAWLRTDDSDMFRIIAMTLKVIIVIQLDLLISLKLP